MDDGIAGADGSFARVGIGMGSTIRLRRCTSVNGPGVADFVRSAEDPRARFLPGLT